MSRRPRVAALAAVLVATACGDDDQLGPPPPGGEVGLELVASGLQFPVLVTAPPGEAGRLFVVGKGGVVRIVKNGTLLPAPFLDIRSRVSTGGEQGLLGLAFHPSYATNGIFVVNYTDVADPTSERVFLALDQPYANHNGGHVYRGTAVPALAGTCFYGDYCSGWVRSFRLVNGQATDLREWPELAPGGQITSFGEDAAGELYLVTTDGKVHKVVPK